MSSKKKLRELMFWICGITRRWLGNAMVTWLASYKVTTLVAHLLCWQKLIRENVAIWTPFGFSCSKKLDIKKQINLLASFSGHDIKVANNKDFCRGTRISKSWRGKACPFVDLHWIFEISSSWNWLLNLMFELDFCCLCLCVTCKNSSYKKKDQVQKSSSKIK